MIDHCSLYWKKIGGGGIYVLYFVEAPIFLLLVVDLSLNYTSIFSPHGAVPFV